MKSELSLMSGASAKNLLLGSRENGGDCQTAALVTQDYSASNVLRRASERGVARHPCLSGL